VSGTGTNARKKGSTEHLFLLSSLQLPLTPAAPHKVCAHNEERANDADCRCQNQQGWQTTKVVSQAPSTQGVRIDRGCLGHSHNLASFRNSLMSQNHHLWVTCRRRQGNTLDSGCWSLWQRHTAHPGCCLQAHRQLTSLGSTTDTTFTPPTFTWALRSGGSKLGMQWAEWYLGREQRRHIRRSAVVPQTCWAAHAPSTAQLLCKERAAGVYSYRKGCTLARGT
jgi:hypothetical protein